MLRLTKADICVAHNQSLQSYCTGTDFRGKVLKIIYYTVWVLK